MTVKNDVRSSSRRSKGTTFAHGVKRLVRRLVTPVWPENCALCGEPLARGEETLCLHCVAGLPLLRGHNETPHVGAPGNSITVVSWFVYDTADVSSGLIRDIKYRGRRKLARYLGREFAAHCLVPQHISADVILPIPLHWTKLLQRTYNQSYEIGLGISDVTGIRIGDNLRAVRAHGTQTNRDRMARAENVRDIFDVRKAEELNGKHIALLDDVITSGATMHSALTAILAKCAPASVTFMSLGRTL